jgi:hypothetical protein
VRLCLLKNHHEKGLGERLKVKGLSSSPSTIKKKKKRKKEKKKKSPGIL